MSESVEPTRSTTGPVRIAVVGLEFGAAFAPIYADHPAVGEVVLCDRDPQRVAEVSARLGLPQTVTDLDEVLDDDTIDAVHLVTGLPDHANHTVRALEAGKHVACAVPMALSLEEIEAVRAARRNSGSVYMMMETAVYTREFLYARDLLRQGLFGDIVFGRGAHIQDMTGWPDYWAGLPPMYYMTHAIAPLLALLDTQVASTQALGAGILESAGATRYGSSFPVETALFQLSDHPAALEITRSLGQMARPYTEAFSIYGSHCSFEWPQLEAEQGPLLFELKQDQGRRGRSVSTRRPQIEDRADLLPPSIAAHTQSHLRERTGQEPLRLGGGHGGSHPHLAHEFISAIVEGRESAIDHTRAAQWTTPGIAAHASATQGGTPVDVAAFD